MSDEDEWQLSFSKNAVFARGDIGSFDCASLLMGAQVASETALRGSRVIMATPGAGATRTGVRAGSALGDGAGFAAVALEATALQARACARGESLLGGRSCDE